MTKIIVKAKAERGFYRTGLFFPREGRIFSQGDLTEAQCRAIAEEPNLHVSFVEDDADDDSFSAEVTAIEAAAAAEANASAEGTAATDVTVAADVTATAATAEAATVDAAAVAVTNTGKGNGKNKAGK